MTDAVLLSKVQSALMLVLLASAPAILVALAVGLIVGFAQALTQIQDQSLPQTVKLVAVLIVILVFGPLLASQIAEHASQALDAFPSLTR